MSEPAPFTEEELNTLRNNPAVLKIQCRIRIMLARLRTRKLREQKRIAFQVECDESLQASAATMLQALHRKRMAQKLANEKAQHQHLSAIPLEHVTSGSMSATSRASSTLTSRKHSHAGGRKGRVLVVGKSPKAGPGLKPEDGDSMLLLQQDGSFAVERRGDTTPMDEPLAEFFFSELHPDSSLTKAFAIAAVSFCRQTSNMSATFGQLTSASSLLSPAASPNGQDLTKRKPTLLEECAIIVLQCWFRKNLALFELQRRRSARDGTERPPPKKNQRRNSAPTPHKPRKNSSQNGDAAAHGAEFRARSMETKSSDEFTVDGEKFEDLSEDEKRKVLSSVIRLQCLIRRIRARRKTRDLKEKRRIAFAEECEMGLQVDAAIRIQAMHRKRREEKIFQERKLQEEGAAKPQPSSTTPAAPLSLSGLTTSSSAPNPQPQLTPSTFAKKKRREVEARRAYEAPPTVPRGTGDGLNALYYSTTSSLMDGSASSIDRCLFWGVRILHSVTMDIVQEEGKKNSEGGSSSPPPAVADETEKRLPRLDFTRWIQGPLGSVLPTVGRSIAAAKSAKEGGRPRSPNQLPALPKTPRTPEVGTPRSANNSTSQRPRSSEKL